MSTISIPPINWTFGDILAKLRNDAELTRAQLAPLVDMSERSIRNYEAGEQFPKRTTVLLWAQATEYEHVDALLEMWADSRDEWVRTHTSGCIYDPPRLFDFMLDLDEAGRWQS